MRALAPGHRVALLAAVLLVGGGLGPWATGVYEERSVMGEPVAYARSTYGGWPVAVAALVAATALLLVPDARLRSLCAAGAFGIALAMCVMAWASDDFEVVWTLRIFEGWRSVEPGWGILVATTASVAGLLASMMGLPRRDPWKGAPF